MGSILSVYAGLSKLWEELTKSSVPSLPNDIHFMIFGELTTKERSSLATSCKQFRAIDFELGNKSFDAIKVEWGTAKKYLNMETWNSKYRIRGDENSPIPISTHNRKLIRRAYTDSIDVVISNQLANFKFQEPSNKLFTMFAQNVQYKKLRVFINSKRDMSENIIVPTLLMNRNLEQAQVLLSYKSSRASHNIRRIREFLMQLPKIDLFRFSWTTHLPLDFTHPEEQIHDDATLFHIVSQTNHAQLTMGVFTVQGIIDAFELVCKSDLETKFISFNAQSSIIEEFFASGFAIARIAQSNTISGDRWLVDSQEKSAILAQYKGGFFTVNMFKIRIVGDEAIATCRYVVIW